MDESRVKEVFSDEEFVKGLMALEEPAEVQAALKEKGIEMTEDEVVQLRDVIVKLAEQAGENGELSLEQIDEAAGGIALGTVVLGGLVFASVAEVFGAGALSSLGLTVAEKISNVFSKFTGKAPLLTPEIVASAVKQESYSSAKIRKTIGFEFLSIKDSIYEVIISTRGN